MKKFDFFNQYRDPVIVIRDYDDVVFKNNAFFRIFNQFTDIKRFAHKVNFEMCPLDSENVDLFSPIFQAITSKENFFARISYIDNSGKTIYYDMTSVKRGLYTILFFTDVSSQIQIEQFEQNEKKYKQKLAELEEENEELQKIKQNAQTQAFRIALINKVSNIIRESMDITVIQNSVLKELSYMFGCFKAYYAQYNDGEFLITESYGENNINKDIPIKFDEIVTSKINNHEISIGYSLSEYVGATPFKQSVLKIVVPIFHIQKMIGAIVLLSYQKRELNEEIEILDAISSQLGNAIIRAELYRKNAQNVKELKQTLDELKATQLQLINSEKMASLGQLVAGIAHEINTPIASIKSNNDMLTKLSSKIENNDLKQMFEQINNIDKEAIERISKIVVSLKKFVRLDEAELQLADINKEIDLTLEIIRHETKNKVEIEKHYGNIPQIKCYPNMLNQVFTNILINACQAIEKQGKITITTEQKANNLEICIKDNGKGIPKENLNKIFTAGFTTKGVGVGTGLGLAISQKIIDKHNGKIRVISEIGVGSEFIITIPCE
ncbi:ATP-binding protein [bacterium]|nr:ATP-binding protein [bacterium]